MTAANSTRVLLCDDHEVVREGLRTLLSRHQDIAVVGEAGTMAEAIEAAAKAKPDVVIMDVRLPDGSGVEACRAIRPVRSSSSLSATAGFVGSIGDERTEALMRRGGPDGPSPPTFGPTVGALVLRSVLRYVGGRLRPP